MSDPCQPSPAAALRAVCGAIPPGRWASYGDVAEAAGVPGGARWAARLLAAGGIPNAHRVILASGRVSGGYREGDAPGGPAVARRRLEDEGVRFGAAGAADPGRRWVPEGPGAGPDGV